MFAAFSDDGDQLLALGTVQQLDLLEALAAAAACTAGASNDRPCPSGVQLCVTMPSRWCSARNSV